MSDTQWPRFEVFVQEQPGRPHQYAGSVHAPDGEMAMLNARDVFVRRPECASLWVAPAGVVSGATVGELEGASPDLASSDGAADTYLVFAKLDERGTLIHVGQVHARGPAAALAAGRRAVGEQRPLVLWVIPDDQVRRTGPEEAPSMFGPSRDKPYRDQAYYHVQTALRKLQRRQSSVTHRRSPPNHRRSSGRRR